MILCCAVRGAVLSGLWCLPRFDRFWQDRSQLRQLCFYGLIIALFISAISYGAKTNTAFRVASSRIDIRISACGEPDKGTILYLVLCAKNVLISSVAGNHHSQIISDLVSKGPSTHRGEGTASFLARANGCFCCTKRLVERRQIYGIDSPWHDGELADSANINSWRLSRILNSSRYAPQQIAVRCPVAVGLDLNSRWNHIGPQLAPLLVSQNDDFFVGKTGGQGGCNKGAEYKKSYRILEGMLLLGFSAGLFGVGVWHGCTLAPWVGFRCWLVGAAAILPAYPLGYFSFYFTDTASASPGSFCGSAPRYRGAENVLSGAVVIAPLELGHVERQAFGRDVLEDAHDAAFQRRPEVIDGLIVDVTPGVLATGMVHGFVRKAVFGQAGIDPGLVRSDQINLLRNHLADELVSGFQGDLAQATQWPHFPEQRVGHVSRIGNIDHQQTK